MEACALSSVTLLNRRVRRRTLEGAHALAGEGVATYIRHRSSGEEECCLKRENTIPRSEVY